MTYRPILIALAAFLTLSACTDADWSWTMHYIGISEGSGGPPPARPMQSKAMPAGTATAGTLAAGTMAAPRTAEAMSPPAQPAARSGIDPFCEAVARQDSQGNDFDAPTQQRVFAQSYSQCVRIFGNVKPN